MISIIKLQMLSLLASSPSETEQYSTVIPGFNQANQGSLNRVMVLLFPVSQVPQQCLAMESVRLLS